jgi:hypothetical protein
MRKSNFDKFLKSLEKEELEEELERLFTTIPAVKKYYSMELGSEKDRDTIFSHAKKSISKYYTTKNSHKPKAPRIRRVQSLLSELSKISVFKHELADLYLYDVEIALDFLMKYYFSSKSVNNNLESSFNKACLIINEFNYQDLFIERAESIMKKAAHFEGIYWSFNKDFLSTFRKK